jgi:hypothetical protein
MPPGAQRSFSNQVERQVSRDAHPNRWDRDRQRDLGDSPGRPKKNRTTTVIAHATAA